MKTFTEIEVLGKVDEALAGLAGEDARGRVIRWASEKYGVAIAKPPVGTQQFVPGQTGISIASPPVGSGGEIPGIAKFVGEELRIIARDINATSTNDAAIRLAHIAIRANEVLTGAESVSSRHIVTPILKTWRAYTGNTRAVIANQKGILRNGDLVSLDEHGKRDADEFIRQCLDPSVEGSWNPTATTKKLAQKVSKTRKVK